MSYAQQINTKLLLPLAAIIAIAMSGLTQAAPATGPLSLATQPLTTSTTSLVKPNVLFILDNSGSMDWDHMPDDDGDGGSSVSFQFGYYGGRSSQCNQVYYDPTITYKPPVESDGDSYAAASFTSAESNGFDTSGTNVNLDNNFKALQTSGGAMYRDETGQSAYYYEYSGSQDTPTEKNYNSTTNTFYSECSNGTASTITFTTDFSGFGTIYKATGYGPATGGPGSVFTKRRLASTMSTPIVVSGTSSGAGSITSITVNGTSILNGTIAVSNNTNADTIAEAVKSSIEANVSDSYSASRSGSVVTVTGPSAAANFTPVIAETVPSTSFTTDVFPHSTAAADLTNFANWYSYYRTRMLMMKTATGQAFKSLDNKYRVGLMKISETGLPAVELSTYEGSHRDTWYSTLYATTSSGSTPLRRALSEAGRYYAGELGGTDPLQYSCQQNFSILSTDGYWNTGDGYQKDGSSAVGNQDGTAARPMFDGKQATDTVTTQYTRTTYSKSGNGCFGSQRRTKAQPEIRSCAVTSGVETCGSWSNNGSATYSGSCASSGSFSLPSPNPTAAVAGAPVTTTGSVGGTSDNLADIAMYYYTEDLRSGTCTLCTDNVFKSGDDNNKKQHMTTFTLGLGASGKMQYTPGYLTATSGDYFSVKLGSTASSTVCTWQAAGTTCNWPVPGMSGSNGLISNIDDLWHAAINGRGAYFSATNPTTLSSGLSNALAALNTRRGSAAAAATSTLNPVAGNNYAYVASYTTGKWKGNLEARGINTETGEVNENAAWCVENVAQDVCELPSTVVSEAEGDTTVSYCVTPDSVTCSGGILDGTNCKVPVAISCTGTLQSKVSDATDTRKIWTKGANSSSLNNFKLGAGGDLSATDFDATKLAGLNQWVTLDATQRTDAVANIVSYLRGQKGKETTSGDPADQLFRAREATLGDAIESQPAFIAKPTFNYFDADYTAFKTAQASRTGVVYIGANDGMMHAFNGNTGVELWAYVPSPVIPNLWKLADNNYGVNHTNYVNGSPIIGDVYYDSAWHTILVAGLNGGGKGYYALDITTPATPTLLWEFTTADDADLGYTFGNPIITKKSNGDWVVLVTSGYNNNGAGDGGGHLYVLNPKTGAKISKISTGAGSAAVPSGLAQIAAWADDPEKNNTATFVYGGDLLGNVWRFDINAETKTKFAKLYEDNTTTTGDSKGQPITTVPELGRVLTADGKVRRVVFIGTGKYLETADLTDTQLQTLYAIKDDDVPGGTATATLVNPKASGSGMVQQTITSGINTRTVETTNEVNLIASRGWFVNFPDSGERQHVASQLVLGTLIVPTTIPSNTVCAPGGTSWLNYFNYKNGGAVDSTNIVSSKVSAPIVGVNVIYIEDPIDGKIKPKVAVVTGDNPTPELVPGAPFSTAGSGFQKKRAIWRELIQ